MDRIAKTLTLALILCSIVLFGTRCIAAETAPPAANDMEALWKDLLADEPVATRALLAMAKKPDAATAFLAVQLKPLILTEDRLRSLLEQLGSKDDKQWQAAFHELEYLDPRLAMDLDDIMALKSVQDYPSRHRLVDILSGRSFDDEWSITNSKFKVITLERTGTDSYNFRGREEQNGSPASWWAEHHIDRLNNGHNAAKKHWTRAIRALALLESFGTDDALTIIQTMAAGHPDAQPTRVANQILARQKKQ